MRRILGVFNDFLHKKGAVHGFSQGCLHFLETPLRAARIEGIRVKKKNTNQLINPSRFITLSLLVLLTLPFSVLANEVFLSDQEKKFLAAEQYFNKGQLTKYRQAKSDLTDYPLLPYLEYRETLRNIGDPSSIESFFEKYPGSYLSSRIHNQRLLWLGSRRQWDQFQRIYADEKKEKLRCYAARADLSVHGHSKARLAQATKLWLTGQSVDDACDPLFDMLAAKGVITDELRWQRIGLAMNKNKLSLARYLSKKLPKKSQSQFQRWSKMHKSAEKTLKTAPKWKDTTRNREIIIHGIKRYSRDETVKAWRQWHDHFKSSFEFTDAQISDLESNLVLRAAWRHMPEAYHWFNLIPHELLNEEATEWRVRTAARAGDWAMVDESVSQLPAEKRGKEQWQYWKARANQQLGNESIADQIYQTLVTNTSYYGFMVADILNQDYTFTNIPVVDKDDSSQVKALENSAAFQRIKALYDLGREGKAYGEWKFEMDQMPLHKKRVAARLAQNWNWHFTAIVTTAQAKHFSDLDLRFPLLYEQQVNREAKKRKVRPSLVYGVMRRESAFKETAVSPAGALGLMQVMPATAKHLTHKLGIKRLTKKQLKKAGHNIKLGTYYLRRVLDRYDNNEILATASYNAGPHRVKKWLPEETALDADVWVDTITFDETRNYVKAVHFYSTIFDWKSNGSVGSRLKDRMTTIAPASQATMSARN
jgi:soluble lytic murein transglycosylase